MIPCYECRKLLKFEEEHLLGDYVFCKECMVALLLRGETSPKTRYELMKSYRPNPLGNLEIFLVWISWHLFYRWRKQHWEHRAS